ncbi:MAG: TIGR00303 family protein [Cyanobacteria bacterium Co-bin13]|nr:TIGR00303 family protein [Cyanobacteria bacterium Co-bin13]
MTAFIHSYTRPQQAAAWLKQYKGKKPLLALVLGFTETGLIPGISAAGATPADRRCTALADAEFLLRGPQVDPRFPLPPLQAGASPTFISRAVVADLGLPVTVFNAGLPQAPSVPCIDLEGLPAQCLSSGRALPPTTVKRLWQLGLAWGEQLAAANEGYLMLGECVVGGTTTALAVLLGLGIAAEGRVNSSHPTCNHAQKRSLVQTGLARAKLAAQEVDPLAWVAAVGDPMQPVIAGMALAASRATGVLLAGGTQMLAVYALTRALADYYQMDWNPQQVVVGTTRWVAEDTTGDTIGLAQATDACLLAAQLDFSASRFSQLRVYEQGFVKEGVGAGGCAIAAHLYGGWDQAQMLQSIEALLAVQMRLEQKSLL